MNVLEDILDGLASDPPGHVSRLTSLCSCPCRISIPQHYVNTHVYNVISNYTSASCQLPTRLAVSLNINLSDPRPRMIAQQFYFERTDSRGKPLRGEWGEQLIDCNRGTNDTENTHRQIITTFGTWCTGVSMSDPLMAERRHRQNSAVSELRRLGFPKLGHVDTWLIDKLQILVFENHGLEVYPNWSNTGDFLETPGAYYGIRSTPHALNIASEIVVPPPP